MLHYFLSQGLVLGSGEELLCLHFSVGRSVCGKNSKRAFKWNFRLDLKAKVVRLIKTILEQCKSVGQWVSLSVEKFQYVHFYEK